MQNEIIITSPTTSNGTTWSFFHYRTATVALFIMATVLCVDMLTGPLRYYFSRMGLEFLIYIPKIFCLLFVLREVTRSHMDRVLFIVLLLLGISSVVAITHQVSFKSIMFAFFVISPFLFGICSANYLLEKERAVVVLIAIVFFVTALGVAIDIFIDFPWKGLVYKVDNKEIEGVREWSTFGIDRVAGFARMSATAAFYLVCSSLLLFGYSRSIWVRFFIFLTAFPLILVTTNKAGIGGFIMGIGLFALTGMPRLQKVAVYGLVVCVILLPLSTLLYSYYLDISDPVSLLLLASFEDRLINTWPLFIAGVPKYGSITAGVGFGGIGSSTKYFASGAREVFSFADNFPLYLFGVFGVTAVPLFLYMGRVTINLFSKQNRFIVAMAPVMVATLASALTTDIIEAQVLALFLGLALSLCFHKDSVTSTTVLAKSNF